MREKELLEKCQNLFHLFLCFIFLYSQAIVEFNDFLINFDVICAGDSSTVMCLHSSAYADIGQWSHDVM